MARKYDCKSRILCLIANHTEPEKVYKKKSITNIIENMMDYQYYNNSQQQRKNMLHPEDYLPPTDHYHEEWHCHPYRRRQYGMWTPLIRGAQESLKEFGIRYADDQIYTLLRWGLTAGLIATIAGASLSINYLIKETQTYAVEIHAPIKTE